MQDLMKEHITAVIMVIGMISMLLPPFGVLLTKWLAIETAVNMPLILIMIVLGSAFTVVFWAKWIGNLLTIGYKKKYNIECLSRLIKASLIFLLVLVIGVSVFVTVFYNTFIAPYVHNIRSFNRIPVLLVKMACGYLVILVLLLVDSLLYISLDCYLY